MIVPLNESFLAKLWAISSTSANNIFLPIKHFHILSVIIKFKYLAVKNILYIKLGRKNNKWIYSYHIHKKRELKGENNNN